MKKKYFTETDPDHVVVDNRTGEITEAKRTRVVSMDEYMEFFFKSIPELCKLKGLQLKILMCCWKQSSWIDVAEKGNTICNNKVLKDYIRECGLDISDSTIDVTIHKLAKENILMKVCKGMYMLNPSYFWKGKLSDRSKLELKLIAKVMDKEGPKLDSASED